MHLYHFPKATLLNGLTLYGIIAHTGTAYPCSIVPRFAIVRSLVPLQIGWIKLTHWLPQLSPVQVNLPQNENSTAIFILREID